MTEKAITAKDAGPIIGKHRKEVLKMAERGDLAGTWFWCGRRRYFLESKLVEWRDQQIQFAASRPSASV